MSYFVVINGSLGSGKSTNAEKLAQILNAKRVALDDVLKENNLDTAQENYGCIPAKNFIKALDIIMSSVREILKKGNIVIFDGCFYHKEVLEHLVQSLDFPHYVFTLKVPIEVCIERDRLREKTLGEDAARAVYGLVSQQDFGIIINANTSLKTTNEKILSYLPQTNN